MRVLDFVRWWVILNFIAYEKEFWRRMIRQFPREHLYFKNFLATLKEIEASFRDGDVSPLMGYLYARMHPEEIPFFLVTTAEKLSMNLWLSRPGMEDKLNEVFYQLNQLPYYVIDTNNAESCA